MDGCLELTMSTPLATHIILSSHLCLESDHDVEYMFRVPYFSACLDLSHVLSVINRLLDL